MSRGFKAEGGVDLVVVIIGLDLECTDGQFASKGKVRAFYAYGAKIDGSVVLRDKGTREIRVILYAKDDSFCATALADELSIEEVLAVEHDVSPLEGADVFQHGEIDSIGDRVALTQDPGDFARLPVDDARQDQLRQLQVLAREPIRQATRSRSGEETAPQHQVSLEIAKRLFNISLRCSSPDLMALTGSVGKILIA
jgi:hypothetical protein